MFMSKLILESGEAFPGFSPEWQDRNFFGEVVFSTGMTGYVESLTDPSFAGQILTFTFPLIGNYGVPPSDTWESQKIQAAGVVAGWINPIPSHWNAQTTFLKWLEEQKVPLICGVDTRALTKLLRKKGVALGAICRGRAPKQFVDPNAEHLVQKVSLAQKQIYGAGRKKIIAVDCGMKENIVRSLLQFDVQVVRVPYNYDYSEEDYDGLFLSNGPGDPASCTETIAILRKNLGRKKPFMGICLGAQLLALAIGGKTYKLKFGHRGQNHPCIDLQRQRALLTSQNHGYAIDEKSLPADWQVHFRSLNDHSVEGIMHKKLPFFAVQFHPESHPGPTDAFYVFQQFVERL
ncbi:MAG: glutamine-hydrolyzing carbamoyl-phosphate synthase small subunit [Verrucomicrobia bacterium]|nr:glutamine-hydrolyzing carbamoyl-phosphate synthase small subunit [Verrucomicrobiota bacterium]MDE3047969.1 glutamine-hydrolyzing carbamoyl-phosphate synthase small subunit [Verrucomicrobiota bacterium]